jgi:mannitol-specific phosphotransferase system IIBC component
MNIIRDKGDKIMSKRYKLFIGFYLLLNIFPIGILIYILSLFAYFVLTILFDSIKGGNNHVQSI